MEYIVSQLMDKDFRTIYFRRYAFAKNWKMAKKYMAIKKTGEYKNFQIEGVAGIETEGPYQGLGFFYRTKVTDKKESLIHHHGHMMILILRCRNISRR